MAKIRLSNAANREAAKRLIDLAPAYALMLINPATPQELAVIAELERTEALRMCGNERHPV